MSPRAFLRAVALRSPWTTKAGLDALAAQAGKGIVCVRSTRVATGRVGRNVEVDDDKLSLVASDDLNPRRRGCCSAWPS